jgi:recombination protein RecA
MFGNPETTAGGRALKFYASVRLDVRRTESLKVSGNTIGNRVKVKVVKNKVAPPFKEAFFDIMFGKGISTSGDILDLAVEQNLVDKSGAWFAYGAEKIGQGRDNAKQYLEDHPDIMAEIEEKVRGAYGLIESEGQTVTPQSGVTATATEVLATESPITDDDDPYLTELKQKDQESA